MCSPQKQYGNAWRSGFSSQFEITRRRAPWNRYAALAGAEPGAAGSGDHTREVLGKVSGQHPRLYAAAQALPGSHRLEGTRSTDWALGQLLEGLVRAALGWGTCAWQHCCCWCKTTQNLPEKLCNDAKPHGHSCPCNPSNFAQTLMLPDATSPKGAEDDPPALPVSVPFPFISPLLPGHVSALGPAAP